MAHSSL